MLAQAANVFVVGEIGGTRVAAGAQRMDLLGKIFEEFAASRHQANLGAVRCNREANRFADAAACARHHSNLILETFHESCRGLRPLAAETAVGRIPLELLSAAFRSDLPLSRLV